MPFLPPNQQRQSTENTTRIKNILNIFTPMTVSAALLAIGVVSTRTSIARRQH